MKLILELRDTSNPRCHLVGAAGISWGEATVPEPSGRLALWLFRHHYLRRRTRRPDGSLAEHYRFASYRLELEIGRRTFGLKLA